MDHCCCICREPDNSAFFKEVDGHHLLKCKNCKLIFSKDLPATQETFFKDSQKQDNSVEYWSTPRLFDQFYHVFLHFFDERLERMKKYGVEKGDVLDIGTGYGLWADYLKKRGFNVDGIEITPEIADYANETYNLSVEATSIEAFQSNRKYDAIFLFDVLEHLEEPEIILQKIKGWLKPHGILYIQVPNVLGIRYPYGHGLGLPYHIWQFNPQTLKMTLNKAGLNVHQHWTGTQGVIGAHQKGKATWPRKLAWKCANLLKIGNRVQVICTL